MRIHADLHAEIVLRVGVVFARFHQQRVDQIGVVGDGVFQVEQTTADQPGLVAVVVAVVCAADTRADLRIQIKTIGIDQARAVTDTEGGQAVVGGEVIVFVAAGRGELAVFAQLQRDRPLRTR